MKSYDYRINYLFYYKREEDEFIADIFYNCTKLNSYIVDKLDISEYIKNRMSFFDFINDFISYISVVKNISLDDINHDDIFDIFVSYDPLCSFIDNIYGGCYCDKRYKEIEDKKLIDSLFKYIKENVLNNPGRIKFAFESL